MNLQNLLRDSSNTQQSDLQSKYLNKPLDLTKQPIKLNKENLLNIPKCNITKDKEKINSEISTNNNEAEFSTNNNEAMVTVDISMLSISGSDQSKTEYELPTATDLNNDLFREKWFANVIKRRQENREEVCGELGRLGRSMEEVSWDSGTGERYIMESWQYRAELELRRLPLGLYYLEGSNVGAAERREMVECLYKTVEVLKGDIYTVPLALAYADRYVKAKGKSLPLSDYRCVVVTCWFLACKVDLVYYPEIHDVCEVTKLTNAKLIIDMEVDIVRTLDFFLLIPTPIEFLRPLTLIKQRKNVSHNVAKFFIDLSLYFTDLAAQPAHIIAASAYCLSMALSYRLSTVELAWTDLMKIFTGLDIVDIKSQICNIARVLLTTNFAKEYPYLCHSHVAVIDVLKNRQLDILKLTNCQGL